MKESGNAGNIILWGRNMRDVKAPGFKQVAWETFLKEVHIKTRYKMDFFMFWVRAIIFIGIFALFAFTLRFKNTDFTFKDTLLFFLIGLYLITYDGTTLWAPYNMVTNDIYNGTLEYIYSTPSPKIGYFMGAILAESFLTSIITIPIGAFIIIYAKLSVVTVIQLIIVLILTLTVLMSFGVMFALIVIMFKQAGPIANVLSSFFTFFSGFLFPIQVLPSWIQWIGFFIPYTWGIDLMRAIIFGSEWNPLFPLYLEFMILSIQLLVFWVLTKVLTQKVEAKIKRQGIHLI